MVRRSTDRSRDSVASTFSDGGVQGKDLVPVELSDIVVGETIDVSNFSKVFRAKLPRNDDDKEYAVKVVRKDRLV